MAKKSPKPRKKDAKPEVKRLPLRRKDIAAEQARQQLKELLAMKPIIVKLGERLPYSAKRHRELVLKTGANGGSETEMALACGLSRKELKQWRRDHKEFNQAVEEALTLAEVYWERRWVQQMDAIGHNANAYKHMIGSRFRETYGEKLQVSGDEDAPLTVIRRVIVDPKKRSDNAS